MFQLDLKSRKLIYEQVVDNLKELIMTGVLKPEEKLPSVRDLSKTLTVNPNTVQKSYHQLESQGYVYTVTGLGTFVSDMKDIKIDALLMGEIRGRLRANIQELLYLGLSYEETCKMIQQLLEEVKMYDPSIQHI